MPDYLESAYWWAYVRPGAIHFFERDWLVNTILFGNYARLRDAALEALGSRLAGKTLQVACVYGDLTLRLRQRLEQNAVLEVVDVVPAQLINLQRKMAADTRSTSGGRTDLLQANASALPHADASVDQVLLFFLLHEQPESIRRATLAEVVRVLRPGGKLVVLDYHRPAPWHPLKAVVRAVFATLEPFAVDLWRAPLEAFLPQGATLKRVQQTTFFGGLYQLVVWQRAG